MPSPFSEDGNSEAVDKEIGSRCHLKEVLHTVAVASALFLLYVLGNQKVSKIIVLPLFFFLRKSSLRCHNFQRSGRGQLEFGV